MGPRCSRSRRHHGCMKTKRTKELGETARISVQKEMAKPRMSKSVREAETNLAASRIMSTHEKLHSVSRNG
jgi:hypothetical protein